MQWNVVAGVFGLYVIDSTVHDGTLNEELVAIKIEVVPLQCRDLADAEAETLSNDDHRSVRLFECRNDGLQRFQCEDCRTLSAACAVLHTNEPDWITLLGEEFPACGTLIHQVHQAPNMGFRLRCHIEVLQPVFDRHRSYFFE